MKIWLLDVYSKTKTELDASFNTFSSSLIRHYEGQGVEPIPVPQEFQMIMIDFMNTSDNQNTERIDRLKKLERETGNPQPKSVFYFNDAVMTECSYATKELSPKIREALMSGVPVVLIAGELRHEVGFEDRKSNYTWLLGVHPSLSVTDITPKSGPISISCFSSDRAARALYEKFQNDLMWEVGFDFPSQYKRPSLFRRKIDRSYFQPLFTNIKKQAIAFVLKVHKSELIVLPNIKDTQKRSHYIAYVLNEFLPQFRPDWFPERWAGSYTPNVLHKKDQLLKVEKERLLLEINEKERRLQNQKDIMISFIDLLTQSDERLVNTVQRAFQEVFGAQITDLDSKRDLQGKPRLFDLIATFKDKRIAVEIKGGNRSLNKVMLDKIQSNLATFRTEFPNKKIHRAMLVLNDQYSKAPENRESLASHMIIDAEKRNITVLTTPTLMELMAMYLIGDLSNQELMITLSKPGLVQIPLK